MAVKKRAGRPAKKKTARKSPAKRKTKASTTKRTAKKAPARKRKPARRRKPTLSTCSGCGSLMHSKIPSTRSKAGRGLRCYCDAAGRGKCAAQHRRRKRA